MSDTAECKRTRQLDWHGCPPTQDRQDLFNRMGSDECILITKHYWQTRPNNQLDGTLADFSVEYLEQRLNTGLNGGCRPGGVPQDYSGWLAIDIESPWWEPFRRPEDFTDEEAIDASLVYEAVICNVRMLRPNAKLTLYNMTAMNRERGYPIRWDLIVSMHALCQGVSPSLYRHGWLDIEWDTRVTGRYVKTAMQLADALSIRCDGWPWHIIHGSGGVGLTETETDDWYGRWNSEGFDGWIMYHGSSAPERYIEQLRALL